MYCPMGHCVCRTVQRESVRIWNDLQDAETYNSPVHEDTITQTFALTLNRQHASENRVHLFGRAEERKNGSDFLWLFFDPNLSRHVRIAVQAKRLYPNGTYAAFKPAQAKQMSSYATSVQAWPIYVFYNFWLFRGAYYPTYGPRRWTGHSSLRLDHSRDFGAIYVPTDRILQVQGNALAPRDIIADFFPLWQPLCRCQSGISSNSLDDLAASFSYAVEDSVCEPLETERELVDWMRGEDPVDGVLDEVLLSRRAPGEGDPYTFDPSFVLGTRIQEDGPRR